MKRLIPVVLALPLILLASCQPRLALSLATEREMLPNPAFTISDPEHPERPHYDTVMVFELEGTLLWHLRAEPFGDQNSIASLRYGEAPDGFSVVAGPSPLRKEGEYSLQVVGLIEGTMRFGVTDDGQAVPID